MDKIKVSERLLNALTIGNDLEAGSDYEVVDYRGRSGEGRPCLGINLNGVSPVVFGMALGAGVASMLAGKLDLSREDRNTVTDWLAEADLFEPLHRERDELVYWPLVEFDEIAEG